MTARAQKPATGQPIQPTRALPHSMGHRREGQVSDLPIGEYGFLSDCHSAALVSRAGSVDWMCLPRFDAPSVFSRLAPGLACPCDPKDHRGAAGSLDSGALPDGPNSRIWV
ncbi:hypothetical protein SAMN05661080_02121 [Modestobacter sp. DSM 44400]|uniref:trehalase-like domain-containing protein n=1 Tax=Modestobacter sp. DSM 44400 TaxID=1550230 RepID=UPI000895D91B|nr:trehalase-like domain-containing protein [Modestobacter sp. DSM 44400]SDY04634.1 hypothetical protein SAMN05661080_02121 [Modestobacter sp. DSM 44400]